MLIERKYVHRVEKDGINYLLGYASDPMVQQQANQYGGEVVPGANVPIETLEGTLESFASNKNPMEEVNGSFHVFIRFKKDSPDTFLASLGTRGAANKLMKALAPSAYICYVTYHNTSDKSDEVPVGEIFNAL